MNEDETPKTRNAAPISGLIGGHMRGITNMQASADGECFARASIPDHKNKDE